MPDKPAIIRTIKKSATERQVPVKAGSTQATKNKDTLLTALTGTCRPSRQKTAPAPAVSSSNPPVSREARARTAKAKARKPDALYVARELMWSIDEAKESKNYTVLLKALELLGKYLGMFGPQAESLNQAAFKVEYSVSPAVSRLLHSLRKTEGASYE